MQIASTGLSVCPPEVDGRPPSSFDRLRTTDGQGRSDHFERGVGRESCEILAAATMEDGSTIACGHTDRWLSAPDSSVGAQAKALSVVTNIASSAAVGQEPPLGFDVEIFPVTTGNCVEH